MRSMRHQDRKALIGQKIAGRAAEQEFPQPGMTIGARDDDIGIDIGRCEFLKLPMLSTSAHIGTDIGR